MVKILRRNKVISFIITLCMVIQFTQFGEIQAMAEDAVSHTTKIYYVGGVGASDTNSGITSEAPFATLSAAADAINAGGTGNYEIILQGNTSETKQTVIGDGNAVINVTLICRTAQPSGAVSGSAITGSIVSIQQAAVSGSAITSLGVSTQPAAVSGSAIIARSTGYTDTLIIVKSNASLTLGESSGNSSITINGMGDQVSNCNRLIKVSSKAALNIYENAVLCNNNVSNKPGETGGAVYVAEDATFTMYGGKITEIKNSDGGAVDNNGVFYMKGGTISNNTTDFVGGIYNNGTLIMDGGTITGNKANSSHGGGIYNSRTLKMNGGEITENYSVEGGGISNSGLFELNGGKIEKNRASFGGGIYNSRTLKMMGGQIRENDSFLLGGGIYEDGGTAELTGGSIENNTSDTGGAIYAKRELKLSGSIEIPAGDSNQNDIYMNHTITLADALHSTNKMLISCNLYDGKAVLSGSEELIQKYYTLFTTSNINYEVTSSGMLKYTGATALYYVGGDNASDAYSGEGAGNSTHPFATVQKALSMNKDNCCVITLQSDIAEPGYLVAHGDVTIKGDGAEKRILRKNSDQDGFIANYGILNIGSSTDQNIGDTLVIDGNQKDSEYSIENREILNIYQGAKLTGFKSSELVANYGTFDMFGGTISENSVSSSIYSGGFDSCFKMSGGSINANTTGWGLIYSEGTGQISGGNISDNTASDKILSISGTFIIEDGTISNNTAPCAINVSEYGAIQMTGGTISGNTGYGMRGDGTVKMAGGTISNNALGGIYINSDNKGKIILSGNPSITAVSGSAIYLNGSQKNITIAGALSDTVNISVALNNYICDYPVLTGDPAAVKSEYGKFSIADSKYKINQEGYLYYIGDIKTCYVNEASGTEISNGKADTPYKTIQDAVSAIGTGVGTIILQSNITLNSPIVIQGQVNLISDGKGTDIILRSSNFSRIDINNHMWDPMLIVYGKLMIGNTDNSSDNKNPSLIIDGGAEETNKAHDETLRNIGTTEIYSGVSLQHNYSFNSAAGILNYGKLKMYGGQINYNEGFWTGGICLTSGSSFLMEGGSITNNIGHRSGGLMIQHNSSFVMNGGRVENNIGEEVGGIYIRGGSLTVNGGCIAANTGVIGGIYAFTEYMGSETDPSAIQLNGGVVKGNSGSNTGAGITCKLPGIAIGADAKLKMSGDALITDGDQIAFFKDCGFTGIEITGALTGKGTVAAVAVYDNMNFYDDIPVLSSPFGLKILTQGESYSLTQEDVDKIALAVPAKDTKNYAINVEGRVGTLLKDDWVNITDNTGIIYNGLQRTVNVTVANENITLKEEVDYRVSYQNNINPGTATVIITGIGSFAGTVKNTFNIVTMSSPVSGDSSNQGTITPVPSPEPDIDYRVGTDGTLHVDIDLSGKKAPGESIQIPGTDKIIEQISKEEVDKVSIEVQIPDAVLDSSQEQNTGIILKAGLLAAAESSEKQIAVTVKDKDGKERYTWTFDGKEAAAAGKKANDVNISMRMYPIPENLGLNGSPAKSVGLILDFAQEGELSADVRIYVGDQKGIVPDSKIYLYHYNDKTGKLETLPYSSQYVVDKDGYITIHISHCSKYVVLTKKADNKLITSLKDQIKVFLQKKTVRVGRSTAISVELPATLEHMDSLSDETSSKAVGGVTIAFSSGNKKIATVNKDGKIKAVGTGKTVITTTIKLYSGKTKIVKTEIKVQKPYSKSSRESNKEN